MNQTNGYIYVRFHESYEKYNACKLGKTQNIPDRDNTYVTSEILRGNFDYVFEVSYGEMNNIEKLLGKEFCNLNIRINGNGAKEFYDKQITELIEPYLIKQEINYRKLTTDQIANLLRCYRIKKVTNKHSIIHSNIKIQENK